MTSGPEAFPVAREMNVADATPHGMHSTEEPQSRQPSISTA